MTGDGLHAARLVRLQVTHEHERDAARAQAPIQEALPFGDGWLDGADEEVEFHGSSVGLRLHAIADEPPCPACAEFLEELAAADMLRPISDVEQGGYGNP
ncbi:hypothetical protein [Lentzea sp. NBRC 102530]|uniref:hypothetical protein n=1 Tax=Lentzea sp. NBRC 102530 TaxID=3032201 RepID=UPI0024A258A5|nr:hypothetical protein [Lentzea sp. NBRC 102530]GLY54877.1 hypothetical protein Lesp01_85320 [Lentzea sp. NBRC 102530]